MGTNNNGVHSVVYRLCDTDGAERMVSIDWNAIADMVWYGSTIPAACEELGLEFADVDRAMNIDIRSFLLDVSMVAGAREEYLGASNDTNH